MTKKRKKLLTIPLVILIIWFAWTASGIISSTTISAAERVLNETEAQRGNRIKAEQALMAAKVRAIKRKAKAEAEAKAAIPKFVVNVPKHAESIEILSQGELYMLAARISRCPKAIRFFKSITAAKRPISKAERDVMLVMVATDEANRIAGTLD